MRLFRLSGVAMRRSPGLLNSRVLIPLRTATTDVPPTQDAKVESKGNWDVRVLYDGECPLCVKEINMLKNRDKGQDKISFVNIATPEYDPEDYEGITYGKAMGRIQGLLPDGTVIEGVEVFRRCYDAVGLGWVYGLTSLKPIERIVNVAYNVWAKYRLPLTGRQKDGIEEMYYWNEPPTTCGNGDEEYCELDWDTLGEQNKK